MGTVFLLEHWSKGTEKHDKLTGSALVGGCSGMWTEGSVLWACQNRWFMLKGHIECQCGKCSHCLGERRRTLRIFKWTQT